MVRRERRLTVVWSQMTADRVLARVKRKMRKGGVPWVPSWLEEAGERKRALTLAEVGLLASLVVAVEATEGEP